MSSKYTLALLACLFATSVGVAQTSAPTEGPQVYYEESPSVSGQFWGSAEYLLWWLRSAPLPVPMVTVSNLADQGVLGAPTTVVVIGNESLDFGARSGGRFTIGGWRDDVQEAGWEGSYFFLASSTERRSVGLPAAGALALSLPYIDANTGAETSTGISSPVPFVPGGDTFKGDAFLSIASRLQGAELNGVVGGLGGENLRIKLLAGFRWLQLTENLVFATSSPDSPSASPDPIFTTEDKFDALNNFYSGQLGVRAEYGTGRLTLETTAKIALGWMEQQVKVNGQTMTNDFTGSTGPATTFAGGYFAQPTNIGRDSRCRFAFAPEVEVRLGYRLTSALRATAGYNFLYVSSVARPGEQIDRVINPTQAVAIAFVPGVGLTGPARPELRIQGTDFWAQGLSFGLEYSY